MEYIMLYALIGYVWGVVLTIENTPRRVGLVNHSCDLFKVVAFWPLMLSILAVIKFKELKRR